MGYIYNLKRDEFDDRDFKFTGNILPHPTIKIPMSVDLRNLCPPVYDQGQLGSCTANAGCCCRSMLNHQPSLLLSRLFLYYEERLLEDTVQEDAGATIRDICKSASKTGICEERFMPYEIDKFRQPPSSEALDNALKYKVSAYRSLRNLTEIKQNLALRQQPVLMGMDVFESFESDELAQTGIMQMPVSGEKYLGGHAVLIVGYKDEKVDFFTWLLHLLTNRSISEGYLIVRNSWGNSWGDHGYFYMPYEYLAKGYAYDFWTMECSS